ncbi:hypothetical protein H0H81_009769 [Sphagnurus paluster]|uniref:Uncharacterized protein n=1 Tax=Sphagnurus paluster TaxID=117069 RepID=A0A9P7FPQ6_9AGAR|nr:hypothetical protein H0H81_009769 [Sphagnurus paluster]
MATKNLLMMFIKNLIPSFLPQASRLWLYILPMRQPPPPAPDIPPVVPRAPTITFKTYIPPTLTAALQNQLALSLTLLLAVFLFTSSLLVAVSLLRNRKCRIEAQHSTEYDSPPHSQPMCDDLAYDDPPLYDLTDFNDDPPLEEYPEIYDGRAEKLVAFFILIHALTGQYLINVFKAEWELGEEIVASTQFLRDPPLYSVELEEELLPTYHEAIKMPKEYDVYIVRIIRELADLRVTDEDEEELAAYEQLVACLEDRVRNHLSSLFPSY